MYDHFTSPIRRRRQIDVAPVEVLERAAGRRGRARG
jgi:hypothetical protein